MFRPPLRFTFPALLFIAGCLSFGSLASYELWRTYRDVESQMARNATVLGTVVSAGLESAFRRGTHSEAREVFRRTNSDRDLELALLLDDQGRILFTSRFAYRGKVLAETPLAYTAPDVAAAMSSRMSRSAVRQRGDTLISLFPVTLRGDGNSLVSNRTGVLLLTHRLTQRKQQALTAALGYMAVVAAVLALLALITWKLFDRVLMDRVRALMAFTGPDGDDTPLDVRGNDELAQITRAVADMAGRLRVQNRELESARGFVTAALDAVPANIAVVDANGRIVSVNHAWQVFADSNGLDATDFGVGTNYLAICDRAAAAGEAQAGEVAAALRGVLAGHRGEASFDYQCETPGGTRYFTLQIRSFTFAGEVLALTSHIDVTEARQAAVQVATAEQRYRTLYNENPAMFFTVDAAGRIASVNDFGAAELGYEVHQLIGREATAVYDAGSQATLREQLSRCLGDPGTVQRWEATKRRRDGSTFRARETGRLSVEPDGTSVVLVVCEDISEADALSRELRQLASTDGLTGLINRYEFERRLAALIEESHLDGGEHVLAYIDLDQFKIINDTSGHIAGDELLRQMAQLIRQRVRREDTLARLGGDEFGIIMKHCSLDQGRSVAQTLCEVTEDFRFIWEDHAFIIGTSIGITRIDANTVDVNEAMRAADAACYAAKDAGRNRVHVYELGDSELARRQGEMRWLSEIQQAMDESRVELYAQPIANCNDGDSGRLHYELLIRMRGRDGQQYAPGAFLPAAERYGLSPRLDRWVIARSLDWLADHRAHLEQLSLCAINLSGLTLADRDLVAYVREQMALHAIPPKRICFEITETAAIANMTRAVECIEALRAFGCWVALDDFGTGMASFAYLKNLPVDFLKIDGMFVRDILNDPVSEAMVRSINEIGHLLGKQTIAEFVESPAILAKLHEIGVDFGQGYAIGAPEPIAHLAIDPTRRTATGSDRS